MCMLTCCPRCRSACLIFKVTQLAAGRVEFRGPIAPLSLQLQQGDLAGKKLRGITEKTWETHRKMMLSCWWRWCLRWVKWVNIWGINQELLWVILRQKLYNLLNGITSIPFWYLGNRRNFCVYMNRSLNSWENHWTKRDIVHETMFD